LFQLLVFWQFVLLAGRGGGRDAPVLLAPATDVAKVQTRLCSNWMLLLPVLLAVSSLLDVPAAQIEKNATTETEKGKDNHMIIDKTKSLQSRINSCFLSKIH
jgi:hypothetical protein